MGASTTPNMQAGVRPVLADREGFRAYERRPIHGAWASIAVWSGGPIMALLFTWGHLRGLPVRPSTARTLYVTWSATILVGLLAALVAPSLAVAIMVAYRVVTPLAWLPHRRYVGRVRRAHEYYGGEYELTWVMFAIPALLGFALEYALISVVIGVAS